MKNNIKIFILFLLLIIFLVLSSITNLRLVKEKALHNELSTESEHIPPSLVFINIALGGFRGIIADILWIRLSTLQDEGNYSELLQLADWITVLQPRNIEIWQFHSWNLAYNISVMIPDEKERWQWVRSGIELLQNHGLMYNPESAGICHAIGWMYQHKIGGVMDSAHLFYKKILASDLSTLTEENGHINYNYLEEYKHKRKDISDILGKYNLKPQIMKQVDNEFGVLDWRIPETHAIYWAWRGLPTAEGNDSLICHRMIVQCLSEIFRSGKLHFDQQKGIYERTPNIERLPIVLKQYEKAIAKYPLEGMFAGRRTLLTDAARIFYKMGHTKEAIEFFNEFNNMLPQGLRFNSFSQFISSPPGTYFILPPEKSNLSE